jgi:hypothetical protein
LKYYWLHRKTKNRNFEVNRLGECYFSLAKDKIITAKTP